MRCWGLSLRLLCLTSLLIWLHVYAPYSHTRAETLSPLADSAIPFPTVPRLCAPDSARVAEIEDQINVLKEGGKYAEAVPLAKQILELRQRHQPAVEGIPWWETTDAERVVADLEYFTTLTAEQLVELEEAELFEDEARAAEQASDVATMIEKAARSLEIHRRILGERHVDVAAALHWLGAGYEKAGAYALAESLYTEMMEIYRVCTGERHPLVARSWCAIGDSQVWRGDYAGGEVSYRHAVSIYQTCHGEEHALVARSLRSLAGALMRQGDYAGAEPILQRCLAITYRVYGEDHLDVVRTLSYFGMFHKWRGDLAKAEPFLTDALTMSRRILGRAHSSITASITNLAALYMDRGDLALAEPLFREALAMMRELHATHALVDVEHPDRSCLLLSRANLTDPLGSGSEGGHIYTRPHRDDVTRSKE